VTMRFLVIAADSEFTRQVVRALRAQVELVVTVDERGIRGWSTVVWRVLGRVPVLRRLRKQVVAYRIRRAVDRHQPTHALILKGTSLLPETLSWMHGRGITLVNWFPENGSNEPYRSWLTKSIGLYDVFLSFDSALKDRQSEFPHTRIETLPFGIEPPTPQESGFRALCDVCFVGAPYPDRVALLESVQDLNLRIYGWDGWGDTSLARFWHGALDARQAEAVYRAASVCVNTNVRPHIRGVNMKTFEICAAGGFQLTDEVEDLKELFVIGKELDAFHSPEEFREKVLYWLAHPEERAQVAHAGHTRVLRDHTMQQRITQLLEYLK
jgi:spore maturation protein CgeB